MPQMENIRGQQFGRLTAEEPIDEVAIPGIGKKWVCRCDCGNVRIAGVCHLKQGYPSACRLCTTLARPVGFYHQLWMYLGLREGRHRWRCMVCRKRVLSMRGKKPPSSRCCQKCAWGLRSKSTRMRLVEALVTKQGMDVDAAWDRTNKISKQRVHQLLKRLSD